MMCISLRDKHEINHADVEKRDGLWIMVFLDLKSIKFRVTWI